LYVIDNYFIQRPQQSASGSFGSQRWRDATSPLRLVAGDDELSVEADVDASGAAPLAHEAPGDPVALTDGAPMEVDEARSRSASGSGGAGRSGESGLELEAGGAHEGFPFGAVGADFGSVELAGGEVGELVAEDFVEEAVVGARDVGGDADEVAVGVATAEGAGEARGELDAGLVGEVGGVPGVEPAMERGAGLVREREIGGHGRGRLTRGGREDLESGFRLDGGRGRRDADDRLLESILRRLPGGALVEISFRKYVV
jgi:hypothetical protein